MVVNSIDYGMNVAEATNAPVSSTHLDGHLLFARTLAALEKYADAESEFEVLISYYPGPQARIYYAEMLAKMSRLREAKMCIRDRDKITVW